MLLVIVGAGASYDCLTERDIRPGFWQSYTTTGRPPLARELFEPRHEFTGRMPAQLHGLAAALRGAMARGSVLEEELEVLSRFEDDDSLSEMMALRFYLHEVIAWCEEQVLQAGRGGNGFDALVRHLTRWSHETGSGVGYVTFNYDRLIEHAVATSGGPAMDDLGSYIGDPDRRLYKLHGSVGWVRDAHVLTPPQVTMPEFAIRNAPHVRRLGPIRFPLSPYELTQREQASVEVPAIAVPTVKKKVFECPDDHVAAMRTDLTEVDRVLVVGWRGAEAHFIADLAEHLPRGQLPTLVANGADKDSTECYDRLAGELSQAGRRLVRVQPEGGGPLPFSKLVGSQPLETLLSVPAGK